MHYLVIILLCCLLVTGERDFYGILGVDRSATKKQIKQRYRQLSMKYHPDRNKEEGATQKFTDVNAAYEVLSDDKKRQIYDRFGEEGLKNGGQQQGGFGGGFNIFKQFFGGGEQEDDGFGGFGFGDGMFGGKKNNEPDLKGSDIHLPLDVSLEDLYIGRVIKFTRVKTAHKANAQPRKCKCHEKVVRMVIINGHMQQMKEKVCDDCSNRFDVIEQTSELFIDVEKGMKDKQSIRFHGEGDATGERYAGDLIFSINTVKHPVFERKGSNLFMKMKITLKEALAGFTRQIEHLDKHPVEVKSDKVLKPGDRIKIEGEGMPFSNDSGKGNLLVDIEIDFPTNLSQAQKDAISKIL